MKTKKRKMQEMPEPSEENKDNTYKKITRQIGVSYFFIFATFLFSPLLVLILTRMLSVKEYGLYSLMSVTVGVLSIILSLNFHAYLLTKLPGIKKTEQLKSFFSLFYFLFIFAVLIGFCMLVFSSFFMQILKIEGYNFEWILVIFLVIISTLSYLTGYYFTTQKRIELSSFLGFFNKSFWIIFLVIFYFLFKYASLKAVLTSWLLGLFVSLFISFFAMKQEIKYFFLKIKKVNFNIIKKALIFGLPLIPVTASFMVIVFADRYMINYFINAEAVGIYSLAYSLVGVILALSAIAQGVFYPYFAELWNKKKDWSLMLNAMLKYSLMILIPLSGGLLILREEMITLISGPKYIEGASLIILLIAYPLFATLTEIFNKNILLKGKTKILAFIYTLGAVSNVLLNFILIPSHGMAGAAIATVISYVIMFVFSCFIAKEIRSKLNFKFLKITRMLLAALIMGAVILPLSPVTWSAKILTILLGGAVYIILLFLFKILGKEEKSIIRSFFPKTLEKLLNKPSLKEDYNL